MGVTNCSHSTHSWPRLHSAIHRLDAPVIYIGAFPILTARPGRRSIYNSYTQVFLREMSFVCRLKQPYCSFPSHFRFLVVSIQLILVFTVLFPVGVISLPPHFSMESSIRCIEAITLSSMLVSLLPPFLHTCSLSTSSLGCKALFIDINFLFLWSFYLSSPLVQFKNSPEYLTRCRAQLFGLFDKIPAI